ncbi:MAG TPA: aminodeoxychorismate/anthranilate synthase component II [Stackebrandtia sp.]|jgi:anthranilate synthase/aminodeoxychorismate synthase-like glutamine amidotransferase|uniref:anthranilate synthase component II n=1 Tax=Stackebrandtia sp. TaxID=2023065 RepID=UPI002D449E8D|nr:aminodeoxychorismate/anthranilate synthase component II [Stackebrandtia sp.]HZE41633.1 aminodeoxychorismate/anthranilate synthase component II [Stackebrandtia sp.]
MAPRVLVADCRDSFVYTIVDYLRALGSRVDVRRADGLEVGAVETDFDAILLSPGPGTPDRAAACHALLDRFAGAVPILGVCLGHQVIAEHYGATVTRAPEPRHGETSAVHHDGLGVFAGLPDPFTAARYHSLAVDDATCRAPLTVTARADDGVVMGLRHAELAVEGVQFHPESVLSRSGHALLGNWLSGVSATVGL